MTAKRTPDGAASDPGTVPATPAGVGMPGESAGDPIGPRVRRAVHDLRQPVQAMRLFVHLLSTRLQRDEDRALVVKLDEALENIEGALRNLMSTVPPSAAPVTPPADEPSASR